MKRPLQPPSISKKRSRVLSTGIGMFITVAFLAGIVVVQRRQHTNNQILVEACDSGDMRAALDALHKGADPNAHLVYENTPRTPIQVVQWITRSHEIVWHDAPVLTQASANGFAPLVEVLLDQGADINATDQFGWTALMSAANSGKSDVVRILLARKARIDNKDRRDRNALSLAQENSYPDVVRQLKQAEARK